MEPKYQVICQDILQWAREYTGPKFHAVLCDPPYGLEFMGRQWDGADGFRRSMNEADAGRENVFGRTSRTSPEYKTGWQSGGGFSSPGIGQRETEWPSFSATSRFGAANPTCSVCGGLARGKKKCSCEQPHEHWKPIGKRRNPENENLPDDVTGTGMGSHLRLYQDWCYAWATAILPHLHPGAYVFAFGGTRTVHRLTCALEDAGFEIRDSIDWMYGSGFPKSLNVGKALDRSAGAEREVVGEGERFGRGAHSNRSRVEQGYRETEVAPAGGVALITAPATDDAKTWDGYGTALKPAHEVIVVARKPLVGTVAENCLKTGSGALNIDGSRIGTFQNTTPPGTDRFNQSLYEQGYRPNAYQKGNGRDGEPSADKRYAEEGSTDFAATPGPRGGSPLGRWPANVVLCHGPECRRVGSKKVKSHNGVRGSDEGNEMYGGGGGLASQTTGQEVGYADADGQETVEAWECVDGCPVRELDRQSGIKSAGGAPKRRFSPKTDNCYGEYGDECQEGQGPSTGGASRFFFNANWELDVQEQLDNSPPFHYCAKAGKKERNQGLAKYLPRTRNARKRHQQDLSGTFSARARNKHPTQKPLSLCQYLATLLAPPAAYAPRRLLVPFSGASS